MYGLLVPGGAQLVPTRYSHMNILTDIISELMLPLFVVMILCGIAGARPEPIVKGLLDLIGAIVMLPFKAIGAIWDFWREERRRAPRPSSRQTTSGTSTRTKGQKT
jgi:hypothetical protein